EAGEAVLDAAGDEDDPLLEQAREDVERPFAPARLLDDHRDEVGVGLDRIERRHGSLSGSACDARGIAPARQSYLTLTGQPQAPAAASRGLRVQPSAASALAFLPFFGFDSVLGAGGSS